MMPLCLKYVSNQTHHETENPAAIGIDSDFQQSRVLTLQQKEEVGVAIWKQLARRLAIAGAALLFVLLSAPTIFSTVMDARLDELETLQMVQMSELIKMRQLDQEITLIRGQIHRQIRTVRSPRVARIVYDLARSIPVGTSLTNAKIGAPPAGTSQLRLSKGLVQRFDREDP
jgi:hypothetical protein